MRRLPTISGDARLHSHWLSNEWALIQNDQVIAQIRRIGRLSVSVVDLGTHGSLVLEPAGPGVVHAVDGHEEEVARITRRSWWGRRWDITGIGFNFELVSDPRPRRWHIMIANAPLGTLTGSLLSYNRVHLHSAMGIPIPAVLLAWQVIARPWEAANEPRGLVPVRLRTQEA